MGQVQSRVRCVYRWYRKSNLFPLMPETKRERKFQTAYQNLICDECFK